MDGHKPDPWWPLTWSPPASISDTGIDDIAHVELPNGERLRINHAPRLLRFDFPPIQVVHVSPDGALHDTAVALLSDMLDLRCFLIDRAYPEVMPHAGHS